MLYVLYILTVIYSVYFTYILYTSICFLYRNNTYLSYKPDYNILILLYYTIHIYPDVIQQYKLRYNEALGIYKVLTSETGQNYDLIIWKYCSWGILMPYYVPLFVYYHL